MIRKTKLLRAGGHQRSFGAENTNHVPGIGLEMQKICSARCKSPNWWTSRTIYCDLYLIGSRPAPQNELIELARRDTSGIRGAISKLPQNVINYFPLMRKWIKQFRVSSQFATKSPNLSGKRERKLYFWWRERHKNQEEMKFISNGYIGESKICVWFTDFGWCHRIALDESTSAGRQCEDPYMHIHFCR